MHFLNPLSLNFLPCILFRALQASMETFTQGNAKCTDDAFRHTQQHVQDHTSLEHHPQRCSCIRDATARSNHAHSSRHADSREQWSRVLEQWSRVLRCSLSGIFTVAEAMRLLSALDDVQLCAHFCQNEFCCFVDMPGWMCMRVDSGRTATTGACR